MTKCSLQHLRIHDLKIPVSRLSVGAIQSHAMSLQLAGAICHCRIYNVSMHCTHNQLQIVIHELEHTRKEDTLADGVRSGEDGC